MSNRLKLFFLGSLGLVILALVWLMFRAGSEPAESSFRETAIGTQSTPVERLEKTEKLEKSKIKPLAESPAPSLAPAPQKQAMDTGASVYTISEEKGIVYLDQSPKQREVLNYIDLVSRLKFPPPEEPEFIGVNEQGFDQYEYKARDGSYVKQWKRSNELAVEEITLENGDKIIRRAPEADDPNTTVSFETKDQRTYKSITYRPDGSVASVRIEEGKGGTTYYYDQQGRLTGTGTWAPLEKK